MNTGFRLMKSCAGAQMDQGMEDNTEFEKNSGRLF